MYKRNRRPTSPGEILECYYLQPRGVTITRFAAAAGLTRKHVSNIIHGRAELSPETAVRFSLVLGTSAALWTNLQAAVQLYDAERKLQDEQPPRVQVGAFALPMDDASSTP